MVAMNDLHRTEEQTEGPVAEFGTFPHDVSSVSPSLFKMMMRSIASSVTIVTTCHDRECHGMTATAVCSVSAEPPSILVVVNQSARSHPLISASKVFVVNVLAEHQRPLSDRFAGKHVDQFKDIPTRSGLNGSPIIVGVAAHIECMITAAFTAGTHTIFVGRVVGGGVKRLPPLLYHDGDYKSVSGLISELCSATAVDVEGS
jgi:flavin reductase (DIM6/NTAB) family NADH-FMN oxidoreductase RutF